MSVEDTGGGGAVKPDAGSAPDKGASVNVDEISGKVAEALKSQIADMVTGAVKRNLETSIASKFEGIDLEALRGKAAPVKPASKAGDEKVNPLQADYDAQKIIVDGLKKDMDGYKTRAMRAGVQEVLAKFKPTTASGELVLDKFAALVAEDDSGKLYVKSGDSTLTLEDSLTSYFKDRPELLQASAREGSGAGASTGWSEKMPTTKAELMFQTVKSPSGQETQEATPQRMGAFIAAKGQAALDALS